jgi:hypothetical protein
MCMRTHLEDLPVIDIRYHEGTCQGGHPVGIPDGCDNDLITDPGNSDNHRQDK